MTGTTLGMLAKISQVVTKVLGLGYRDKLALVLVSLTWRR
jgi:hypothetical protein